MVAVEAVRMVAMTLVLEAVVSVREVPVALVKVRAFKVERLVTFKVLADNPPPNVEVPCPAPTVMAPAKVEVAVEVEMRLPRMTWP